MSTHLMNPKKPSDIEIFESIVSQNQDRLFRFAFMRIGVREIAEDIVQDVFIRLFRSISGGTKIKKPENYLLQGVSNACIDRLLKKKELIIPLEEADDIPNEIDEDISEEFKRISILLDGLPFEQAETVRLKCYDDLTFRQIAELHGLPEATVKSRYRYAIQHIKNKLSKND